MMMTGTPHVWFIATLQDALGKIEPDAGTVEHGVYVFSGKLLFYLPGRRQEVEPAL